MSAPLLDLTDPASPLNLPAFIGYARDGDRFVWRVCAWCDGKREIDAEAKKLGVPVSHGMCDRHYAEQLAKLTGDTL